MSTVIDLAAELIRRPSLTPQDSGCMDLVISQLAPVGFIAEFLDYGNTRNLWLRRGTEAPLTVLLGHTDVVPPGPLERWSSPPFEPTTHDGMLYGRGAADMKSGIAAMTVACERFAKRYPQHRGSIAVLLTSDEEGSATNGIVKVIQALSQRGVRIDWCLVGEPSAEQHLGDTVKIGRRGSLNGYLRVHGVQGHVAYPHKADNPIHRFAAVLKELTETEWDRGNTHFPPTTFQVSNIHAGTGTDNVIPGTLEVRFNWRYSTELDQETIQRRALELFDRHGLRYDLAWSSSGLPFLTSQGELLRAVQTAIREVTGREARTSTSGGTSDGRFVAPTGAQVVELGPVNASIHKVNEHVAIADIEQLCDIYQRVLEHLHT